MSKKDPNMKEIFIDPEHALKRPNEAILKLAFNEDGVLGLISSYQDIGDTMVFIGINISDNSVWLSQTPLVLKASIDSMALANAVDVIDTLTLPESPLSPQMKRTPDDSYPPLFLGNLFRALGKMPKHPLSGNEDTLDGKEYFGHPDFKNAPKFKFDMDGFLEAFDAGNSEKDINDDFPDFENPEDFEPDPNEDV